VSDPGELASPSDLQVPRFRISTRWLLVLVLACSLVVWLWKYLVDSNRLSGQRFALIGFLDIDRDGRDDRARIKKLILGAGGVIDYDLPPGGPASGKVGPMTTWYVEGNPPPGSSVPANFKAEKSRAISEARLDGVSPLTIERLRARLGIR
jgi:hypothetical protein